MAKGRSLLKTGTRKKKPVVRKQRSKAIGKSILDEVPGVGARRKKALLHHFGDAKAVSQAGRTDLEAVEGISSSLAAKIYDWFHADG